MSKRKTARTRPVPANVFARVRALAMNLHWTWNPDAQRLFAALDPRVWEATNHDPLLTLDLTPASRRDALQADAAFRALLENCERQLHEYLATKTWFERTAKGADRKMLVAYFCSEYAIHESFPQYAGGLGVLAGDHLKTVSDLGIPLVGVGLLYRSGYYQQHFVPDGSQQATYPNYEFERMPLVDTRKIIKVPLGDRTVQCRIWKMQIGRTDLYLLDADIKANRPKDRTLTHRLYAGSPEHRLQQQVLLGVGGFRALILLGIHPTVCHLNEGHAAFCGVDRLRAAMAAGASLDEAVAKVRASSVFTTHTPVPAGHDRYDPKLVAKNLSSLIDKLGMNRERFLALGREDPNNKKEPFCMTVLALWLSKHCNGVAALHGDTSRRMWQHLYTVKSHNDVPIGHVTNGVHPQTWLAPDAFPLYAKRLKPKWNGLSPKDDPWKRAAQIRPDEFWTLRNTLRARLVEFIRARLLDQARANLSDLGELAAAYDAFDPNALTIGFARRFATYKRAPLIFRDTKRLAAIVNNPNRPVQLVFAGKAHPADLGGQDYAKQVYRHAHSAGFRGRVVVIENYDMHIGRMLTSGCDVWLNNPIRPMEASGTSGMKPPLHGGLNCSILDGWWPEAYNHRNGWAIGDGRQLTSNAAQDKYDVSCLYELLETQIVPAFFDRGRDGVPKRWVKLMVESMKTVCAAFSSHRMLGEYTEDYYLPAHRG